MSESATSKIGGMFKKKWNPTAEKKKKHKREPSVTLTKAWSHNKCEADDLNRLTEADGEQITSNAATANPKEKSKNTRRRLPFGKPKSMKMRALNSPEDATHEIFPEEALVESYEVEKTNEVKGEEENEIAERSEKGNQQNIQSGRPEDEEKDTFPELITEVVAVDLVPDIQEHDVPTLSPESCQDENTPTIPNPEGYSDHEKQISPLKELVFNENRDHVEAISSNSQCRISLYAYDFSFGKLIGLWSFVLGQASDCTKQLLLYFISSLIKRYPHCFKLQVKKIRRRSKHVQKEAQTRAELIEKEV